MKRLLVDFDSDIRKQFTGNHQMKDHEQYIITYRMAQKLLILLLLLLWLANPAWGEDEDLVFPSTVLDEGSEQGATVQRSPRPTSKIADRKSTRLNSSHRSLSRMPSSA